MTRKERLNRAITARLVLKALEAGYRGEPGAPFKFLYASADDILRARAVLKLRQRFLWLYRVGIV